LTEIGSKTAEKSSAQTNRQTDKLTDRHYENNGHLAVKQQKGHRQRAKTRTILLAYVNNNTGNLACITP